MHPMERVLVPSVWWSSGTRETPSHLNLDPNISMSPSIFRIAATWLLIAQSSSALVSLGAESCPPVPFLLEVRSANGSKTKVGWESPLPGSGHRFFLVKKTVLDGYVIGYSDATMGTSGSGTKVVQWEETWDRFSSNPTEPYAKYSDIRFY
jgi:hypothetical protein